MSTCINNFRSIISLFKDEWFIYMYALDRLLYLKKKKRATASTAFVPTGVEWNALKTDVRRYLPLIISSHVINIMMLEMFYLMKFFIL